MQGKIFEWTHEIIQEYKNNFPNVQIVVSTWTDENTVGIPCEVIKINVPSQTSPHTSTINHQIIGVQTGLQKMKSSIIMKCRTDMFIHNHNVFKLFLESCTKNQIMVCKNSEYLDKSDYLIDDICQIAYKEVLTEYWNSMPLFDGSYAISPEIYLTKKYIQNIKKDMRSWPTIMEKYFCVKGISLDFQIEWEKFIKFEYYQKNFSKIYNH